jgi:two-component system sensor histidine kinase UhpB
MKKGRAALTFLLFVLAISVHAQSQNKIDSLRSAANRAADDTTKANLLNDLSKQFRMMSVYDSAEKYSDAALALSEKLNFKKGKMLAYNGLGVVGRGRANYAESLKNYNAALKIAEELNDKNSVAAALVNMGLVYWNQGYYSQALTLYFKGLKIDEELNNPEGIAIDHVNIANVYSGQGNNSEALKYFLMSLQYFEKVGDYHSAATIYNNIGNIYIYQNNYADGLKNLLQALDYFEKSEDAGGMAMTYNNLGDVYYHEANYEECLKSHLNCLKMASEIGDKLLMGGSYRNIGSAYLAQKKYSISRQYLDSGLALAKGIGMKELIQDSYKMIARWDSSTNNFEEALQNYKMYNLYKDSLLNEASSKQTAEMKAKYETEKKDKEIVLQDLEIKKQKLLKYSFIGGLAALILVSGFFFNNIRVRNQLKLQTLRNKIASDLHDDVGSTLSSIAIFTDIAKQQTSEVTPMLEQIGDNSRKMLDAMADIVWTINPENDQFEKIVLRMRSFAYQLLGARKIDFEFDADENVTKMKLPMDVRKNLYLIFKEATNNLVKYSDAKKASFSIKGEKNNLTMLIRDNGIGFDVNKITQGNGLKNMKRRAKEIKAQLLVESESGNGTTVQLILALA